ncbi:hypothetical protein SAMN05444369_12324 [Capnocytophaga haemolytica]|mgnify:CR=1 FL=1|uniref:Uncharacterized protein n=1 Tax=Capnocytophaga haemolytica TaxID=45243 RepID=A0AAX2GZD2_9FLAO|nr:hypothetical protein [Capnocytophaga haemolytica]AMD84296.1 hypothetical protein AXF12_01335 [Capnocytophaga haemolytica]SFO33861.1 hypothetical protein SAMN05444369_12324 [Capnocytophaga haemolytica]SNV12006.1 Uncharacterised protein [Capnocytophaga haemolytica]
MECTVFLTVGLIVAMGVAVYLYFRYVGRYWLECIGFALVPMSLISVVIALTAPQYNGLFWWIGDICGVPVALLGLFAFWYIRALAKGFNH